MKQPRFCYSRAFLALLIAPLFLVADGATATAQQTSAGGPAATAATPQTQETPKAEKGTWRVRLSKQTPQTISIKATDARLAEIAGDLSRRLKVQVLLSPVMEKRRVTVDFASLTLDAALRQLAPKPYIDYEVGGTDSPQPKVLAVYLYGLNEQPPDRSIALQNKSEAILIEGDTEEGTEEYEKRKKAEEQPLTVSYSHSQLSVTARKQPLSVVLYKIATEIGVPFEMRNNTSEVVDVEFVNYPLEQAMRSLSPSVRFYFRTDLQTFEIQPLRIAVAAPSTAQY